MKTKKIIVGWSEWCALPALHLPIIHAKCDTGAKTSALHVSEHEIFHKRGVAYVRFWAQPLQNHAHSVKCVAKLLDERYIMSSTGHREKRYVIETAIQFADQTWPIELSLAKRDALTFRLLLGRAALSKHLIIDPARQNTLRKIGKKARLKYYGLDEKTQLDSAT